MVLLIYHDLPNTCTALVTEQVTVIEMKPVPSGETDTTDFSLDTKDLMKVTGPIMRRVSFVVVLNTSRMVLLTSCVGQNVYLYENNMFT